MVPEANGRTLPGPMGAWGTGILQRWIRGRPAKPRPRAPGRPAAPPGPPLAMRRGTRLPIVDWEAMDAHAPSTDDREALDTFWSSVARGWLDALRRRLGAR